MDVTDAPSYEIIVADNGSTDSSREIAVQEGARVVPVERRGYGAALIGGISAAKGRYVAFADADATYPYEDTLRLYQAGIAADADLAIASRLKGRIEPGAMPVLHRLLGTPVLTFLINLLFHGSISDCNSGFRCVKKTSYERWQVHATGMEFASELIIKALKQKSMIVEIPSGLRADTVGRTPHLRTWRDGMRHLLFILSEKPLVFERAGLTLTVVASLLQIAALAFGQIEVRGASILGLHTQVLLLLLAIVGAQIFHFGAICYVKSGDKPGPLVARIVQMDEGRLFFFLLFLLLMVGLTVVGAVTFWGIADFRNIHFANVLIGLVHFIAMPISLAIGMLGVHVIKRYN